MCCRLRSTCRSTRPRVRRALRSGLPTTSYRSTLTTASGRVSPPAAVSTTACGATTPSTASPPSRVRSSPSSSANTWYSPPLRRPPPHAFVLFLLRSFFEKKTPNVTQGENKSIAPKSIGFYIYESATPGQRLTSTKGLDLLCKGKFRKQKEGRGPLKVELFFSSDLFG